MTSRDVDARKVPMALSLSILLLASVAVALPRETSAQGKAGCEREAISTLMSPDDVWVALVQEDICADGYFVTTVTDTVQIARRDIIDTVKLTPHADVPKHENDVFAIDEHGAPINRPLTRWLSARELQITIPNKSLIGLQKSSYQDVRVIIKYEPDDPAERERWLKSLGLSPR